MISKKGVIQPHFKAAKGDMKYKGPVNPIVNSKQKQIRIQGDMGIRSKS